MEFDVKLDKHGRGLKSCKYQNALRILISGKLNLQQFDSISYEIQ